MSAIKAFTLNILIISSCFLLNGQPVPLNPVSYRIFTPFVYNPAIAGSKDFSSLNLIAAFQGDATSTMLSAEGRLPKKSSNYFSTSGEREFSNFGIGGAVYKDLNGLSKNVGGSLSAAYHIPVSKDNLSFIALGASVKGVQNTLEYGSADDSLATQPAKETFFPNVDLGLYYYGKNAYVGVSVNNLLGNPEDADSLGNYEIPVSQSYFFTAGYKIMLIPSINMVLEPSIIFEVDDFDALDPLDNLHPLIKIYMEDFCFGMFFYDKDMTSFFFQYRYPGFYLGAYYGMKKNSTYYMSKPLIEFTAGVNLSRKGMKVVRGSHW